MKKIQYLFEYLLMLMLLGLVDILPVSVSEALVGGLAEAWYFLSSRRRSIAVENILTSGICADPAEAARIARRSFRHFGLVILESLRSFRALQGEHWRDLVEMNFSPEIEKILMDPKQGVIVATGHLGSWEIAGQLISLVKPVVAVARRMNNPYVNNLMSRRKPRERFQTISKYGDGNTGRFLQVLKGGNVLGLMIDQHASWGGMMVDFFGKPASTYRTSALLHLVTGAPLCFLYCRRKKDHKYEIIAKGPFYYKRSGDRDADARRILTDMTRELEDAIRTVPDQYLWGHRRWKAVTSAQNDTLPCGRPTQ